MPLLQVLGLSPPQHVPLPLELVRLDLQLGQQMFPPHCTAQEIGLDGFTKLHGNLVLAAEEDHVGEVVLFDVCCFRLDFSKYPAGREDGRDGAVDEGRGRHGEVAGVVDGDDAVGFQQHVQAGEEFGGEELDGLGAAGEDVVDDVVVGICFGGVGGRDGVDRVADVVAVVRGEVEVFEGEFVDDRVEFNNGGVDAVVDQGRGSGADAEADVQGGFLGTLGRGMDKAYGLEHEEDGIDGFPNFPLNGSFGG